ncbi:hypothetical protein M514_11095 [Trichuris suis]|uniref:Uncharacterized protein n=1 Tax=Trichuris suis TaxID=68888 RepID=A0A085LSR7_9BILA|nr:hypothetical protein M513_11095 [Trichuris suis]KFD65363.1 hypothetical protein M514_11095 [Trichuris suis]
MSGLIRSGIVCTVSSYEADLLFGRVWYLPRHPVRHHPKPDKVRLAFDASAKFDGFSFNDCLSKGTRSAVSHDFIAGSFSPSSSRSDVRYSEHVPPSRCPRGVTFRPTLSLVRRCGHSPKDAPIFTRQELGLTSAPASFSYPLLNCIYEFLPQEVALWFSRQFYVDNYLNSFSTPEEVITHCAALKEVLSKGGLPLVG